MVRDEDGKPPGRHFMKSPIFRGYSRWKEKLRENCCKRVHEQRANLLWKLRLSEAKETESSINKDVINFTFQEIVDDEFKKIRIIQDANKNAEKALTCTSEEDMLWEYDGIQDAYQGDCEDILLEMQRIFYEELEKDERTPDNVNDGKNWEDEEDEYLAHAVYEHMQLNNDEQQAGNATWCPICNQGKLQENPSLISCTLCEFKLKSGNEITVDFLREQLAEAHAEHLGKGCRLKPKFCVQTRYGLSALYMECQACTTFEVVV